MIKTSFSFFEWRTQAKKGHRTNGGQVLIGMPPDIFDHISDFWDNSTIHLSPLQLLLRQCHLCSNRKKKYNLRIFTNVFFRFFGKLGLNKNKTVKNSQKLPKLAYFDTLNSPKLIWNVDNSNFNMRKFFNFLSVSTLIFGISSLFCPCALSVEVVRC